MYLQRQLFRGKNGMHFLMVPATHTEKLTATIVINTVYHFIMILAAYAIGNILVTLLYHLIIKIQVPVNWDLFQDTSSKIVNGVKQISVVNTFWKLFGHFALFQSFIMLGTLYFQRNAFFKTILSLLAVIAFLGIIQLILFKSIWDVKYLSNAVFPAIMMISNNTIPEFGKVILNFGSYMLLPFVWLVSYFKLKEKHV